LHNRKAAVNRAGFEGYACIISEFLSNFTDFQCLPCYCWSWRSL